MQLSQADFIDTGPVAPSLSVAMSADIATALEGLGRTEDIRLSPDNSHVAIAGFLQNRLMLFRVNSDNSGGVPKVRLDRGLEIVSDQLQSPHGIHFIDERTLVVANRMGSVVVFKLPEDFGQLQSGTNLKLDPVRMITRANLRHRLRMPGSVYMVDRHGSKIELLVCDSHKGRISRHIIDIEHRLSLPRNAELLKAGLKIPDGITLSTDKRWVAISNHVTHQVFVYDRNTKLTPLSQPVGICNDVEFPHGLRFSRDGQALYVADAGRPFVNRYVAADGDWYGTRSYEARAKVMDDATFLKGRTNPQEGGPKGLDISSDGRLLMVTSQHQPFGLFSLPDLFL